jgi:glycerol-3-phosphate dehydrogenase
LQRLQTTVLIIGGGATGTGLARDLTLRGIDCTLVERRDINAGASGANHGLLHSGGRYAAADPETARECRQEGQLLKRLAPHCIEETGGLFVAVAGDDERYVADFPRHCEHGGLPVQALTPREAREMEPRLSDQLIAAYHVEDAALDPFKLSLENMAHAQALGARLLCHAPVTSMRLRGGRVSAVSLRHSRTGLPTEIEPRMVVNATGAWAAGITAMAGIALPLLYSKGSLVITDRRLTRRVVNRLRPATDGDILVPGGTVSLLGTTSLRLDDLRDIRPTIAEIDAIVDQGAVMVPALRSTRFIRAYAGVRPLFGTSSNGDDRRVSRGFALLDHGKEGVDNFITITGGKLTTFRLMAEKTADLVCRKLGLDRPCRTRTVSLPDTAAGRWTEPGLGPRRWMHDRRKDDTILCECEMVPSSALDEVTAGLVKQQLDVNLRAIGLRSRVGKGSCQGAFCGVRILAHLYERGALSANRGLEDLRAFLGSRWRGLRPVLWDVSLVQEELQEALHCGLFGLEQTRSEPRERSDPSPPGSHGEPP